MICFSRQVFSPGAITRRDIKCINHKGQTKGNSSIISFSNSEQSKLYSDFINISKVIFINFQEGFLEIFYSFLPL